MGNILEPINDAVDPGLTELQYGGASPPPVTAQSIGATGVVLSISQGGTGANTAPAARAALGAALSGNNSDINSLNALSGNVILSATSSALKIKEGVNAVMGVVTLVAGTNTVSASRVTNISRIFLSNQTGSGVVGFPYVGSRIAGTSFVITSTSLTDTSDIAYLIIEPA